MSGSRRREFTSTIGRGKAIGRKEDPSLSLYMEKLFLVVCMPVIDALDARDTRDISRANSFDQSPDPLGNLSGGFLGLLDWYCILERLPNEPVAPDRHFARAV